MWEHDNNNKSITLLSLAESAADYFSRVGISQQKWGHHHN